MTSIREKRNPKASNRFSSDSSRIEIFNDNGETIIDYNDNTTSTTHNLAPINRAIKLKPTMREPLKVKLPKLKRPHQEKQPTDGSAKSNIPEIRIHKIKLPSLTKKPKSILQVNIPKEKQPLLGQHHDGHKNKKSKFIYNSSGSDQVGGSNLTDSPSVRYNGSKINDSTLSTTCKLDISTSSKSSGGNKSVSTGTSLSSDEADTSSGMQIVVSQSEQTNSSGIRCPCGVDDDLGVMVECESCSTWQHGHCINVGSEDEAYEGYICAFCALPQDKYRESLRQLSVNDKLQSRFELIKLKWHQVDKPSDSFDTSEVSHQNTSNDAQMTIEELSQATRDVRRVLGSLRVKWRLLTSQAYEAELRIWQNSYWCDESQLGHNEGKNFYFMDRCRDNLRFNVGNMIQKVEERCTLIKYALSSMSQNCLDNQQGGLLKEKIVRSIEEFIVEIIGYKKTLIGLSSN